MVRMRSPVQTRFAAPFFLSKFAILAKIPGCGGREFHIKNLFFEGLLVVLGFAEAKN